MTSLVAIAIVVTNDIIKVFLQLSWQQGLSIVTVAVDDIIKVSPRLPRPQDISLVIMAINDVIRYLYGTVLVSLKRDG